MKKEVKSRIDARLGAAVLSVALMLGLMLVPAGAVGAISVTATLSPQMTIVVDGKAQTFYNVQGEEVHPVAYNGTTYLPVRAIGELMDKNVNWDQSALTITLAGERTTGTVAGTPDSAAQARTISAQLRQDFTIVVDGQVRSFRDVNGNAVYPLLYDGTTYLPVRAIGELMGKNVSWNGASQTVTLSGNTSGDSLVTDADSFENSGNGQYIGESRAKEIALNHAGLSSSAVTFVKVQLSRDDGRWEYEVEFYTKDYREYDYEIDAVSGTVLSYDYDAEDYRPSSDNTGNYIGVEKAKSIALERAGVSSAQASFKKAQLDWDDGRARYEIEFIAGNYSYEFEIDAQSGTILDYERDSRWD